MLVFKIIRTVSTSKHTKPATCNVNCSKRARRFDTLGVLSSIGTSISAAASTSNDARVLTARADCCCGDRLESCSVTSSDCPRLVRILALSAGATSRLPSPVMRDFDQPLYLLHRALTPSIPTVYPDTPVLDMISLHPLTSFSRQPRQAAWLAIGLEHGAVP